MIPNPIQKVLSTLSTHQVRYLLMGGQACVFYGAAEFSRDTDFAILASPENLDRLKKALAALQARTVPHTGCQSDAHSVVDRSAKDPGKHRQSLR